MKIDNKRKRLRINFSASAVITEPETGSDYSIAMTDISMNGLRGISDGIPLKKGQRCDLKIIIPGKASRLIIETTGKVARNEKGSVAVNFEGDLEWWAIFSIYKPYGDME